MSQPIVLSACILLLGSTVLRGGSAEGFLLVANKGDRTLGILDTESGTQIAAVPVEGVTGHEVVASPDGRLAFVPIYGNSGVGAPGTDGEIIRVVDLEARKVAGTFDYGKGVRPHCAVFGPTDGLLYVTAELEKEISILNPRTLKREGSIPTGQAESHMLAITADGKRGYTANVGPGTVSALDLERRKVIKIISVAEKVQRIAVSVDGKWAFTSDQGARRLAVIDTAANGVSRWVDLPGTGYGTAPTPDGKWLVVAMPGARKVGIVDLGEMKLSRTFDVPKAPQEVLVRPDGAYAYVSCDASAQVAVIDLRSWKLDKAINAGHGADGLAWAAGSAK